MNESNSFCKYLPCHNDKFSNDKFGKNKSDKDKSPEKHSFISSDTIVPHLHVENQIIKKFKRIQSNVINITQDLFVMHKTIIDHLEQNYYNLYVLKKRLKILEWIKDNTSDSIELIDAKKEIFQLKKKLTRIENRKEIEIYEREIKPLIEEYKSIRINNKSFIYSENHQDDEEEIKKEIIITKFLTIARNYIDIEPYKQKSKKLVCSGCNKSDFDIVDDNLYTCNHCGICIQLVDETHSYKDIDRINLSSRYTYTKKGHFKEAIDKHQGRQNTTISKKVYDMLYKERKKHNIGLAKFTRDHTILFLCENGYSKHYEDATLIHCTITKKQPPDISMYEHDLLNMFDQEEEAYEKVKDPDRINSLNVNYKLFKLLEILGYKCKSRDFDIPKTRDKISDHDDIWRKICNITGWKFIPTI